MLPHGLRLFLCGSFGFPREIGLIMENNVDCFIATGEQNALSVACKLCSQTGGNKLFAVPITGGRQGQDLSG